MEIKVLGPLEIRAADRVIAVGGLRQQVVLALLALEAGRVVSPDRMVDALWHAAPPATARKQVQICVSRLRKALRAAGGGAIIVTEPAGYRLRPGPDDRLDLLCFEHHVASARSHVAAGHHDDAGQEFRLALAQWRGRPADGLDSPTLAAAAQSLEQRRLAVLEEYADLELGRRRPQTVIDDLAAEAAAHPLREGLHQRLMLALALAGRRDEALRTYERLRETLVTELGLDPSAPLRELHRQILRGDHAPERPPGPAAPGVTGTDRPPALATSPPPVLPPRIGAFTGRAEEMSALDRAADPGPGVPIVVLTGVGGVGKTTLAVHWAHRVLGTRFDTCLYADLHGYDEEREPAEPTAVLNGFLHTLGVPAHAVPPDLDGKRIVYRETVAGRRLLVLLDNARSSSQVRPLLPGTPGGFTLVTARDRLDGLAVRDGARIEPVGPLPLADAIRLLEAVAGPEALDAAGESAGRLARVCDRLPLALRIAACRLASGSAGTVVDLLAELSDDELRLNALSLEGAEDGVAATFMLSYRALRPEAARLFRLVGLAPATVLPVAAVAALAGTTREQVKPSLDELDRTGLVRGTPPGRYETHDLLRLFARTRAREEDSRDAPALIQRRLTDFYLDAMAWAARLISPRAPVREPDLRHAPVQPLRLPDREAALRWCDAERANLVLMVAQAAASGWDEAAWQLADRLFGYFHLRRLWPEWLRTYRIGLDAAMRRTDPAAAGRMHNGLGVVNKQLGRTAVAREHYEAALRLAVETGDEPAAGRCHVNLGGLLLATGEWEAAEAHLREAVANPWYGRLPQYATITYLNLGCLLIDTDRLDEANTALHRALNTAEESGDAHNACYAHHNLAEVALRRGEIPTAHEHAERELRLATDLGDPLREASALDMLGSCLARTDLEAARGHWAAAHRRYRRLEHRPLAALLGDWLADVPADAVPGAPGLTAADEERRRRARRLL